MHEGNTPLHGAGGFVQISGARIIAQAAPKSQHVILGSGSQGFQVGKAVQKALEIRDRGFRAGLLQHDLGKPDAVRILVPAPGKIAMPGVIPGKQARGERMRRFGPAHASVWTHSATTYFT